MAERQVKVPAAPQMVARLCHNPPSSNEVFLRLEQAPSSVMSAKKKNKNTYVLHISVVDRMLEEHGRHSRRYALCRFPTFSLV